MRSQAFIFLFIIFFVDKIFTQFDIRSVLFTYPNLNKKRCTDIFKRLLELKEFAGLKGNPVDPQFLLDLKISATEEELKKQLIIISNPNALVEVGPNVFYGPEFFKKVNLPARDKFNGYYMTPEVAMDVLRASFEHLTSDLPLLNLVVIDEFVPINDEDPFAATHITTFLRQMIGSLTVFRLADYKDVDGILSKILILDANVVILNVNQDSAKSFILEAQKKSMMMPPFRWLVLNGGLTMLKDSFEVQNTRFYAIELAPNGKLTNMPELNTKENNYTVHDLIFRDMAVVGLTALCNKICKENEKATKMELITMLGDNQNPIQTWKFHSYIEPTFDAKTLYSIQRSSAKQLTVTLQPLRRLPTPAEILQSVKSKPLRIGITISTPLIVQLKDGSITGPIIEILNTIGKKYKFTYTLTIFDAVVGIKTVQGWTDGFKKLQERNIDVLVGPFTETRERQMDFHSTKPFQSISYKFVFKPPSISVLQQIFQFAFTFDLWSWAVVLGAAFATGALLTLLQFISSNKYRYTIHSSMVFSFGYLLQGVRTRPANKASSQCLIATWWFFCLVILLVFITNYAAYRSFSALSSLPSTLSSLLVQNVYKYAYVNQSATMIIFENSLDKVFKAININVKGKFSNRVYATRDEAIKKVQEEDFALLDESPYIDYYVTKYCLQASVPFWTDVYAFYLPKYSPLIPFFDEALSEFLASGVIANVFSKAEKLNNEQNGDFCGSTFQMRLIAALRNSLVEWSEYSVQFDVAFGIFIVVFLGLIIVCIIAIVEACFGVYKDVSGFLMYSVFLNNCSTPGYRLYYQCLKAQKT